LATLAAPGVSATARSREDVTDHDLVQAVRAGDDHAFERLYHRYHRRIAAYIVGMVRDHGRAEDLTQEVFVSALRRMRQTDRTIAFKPWIYEIAKNACIDAFRRSRRAEEVSYDAEEGMGPADYGKLVATSAAPEVAVDNKQRLDDLCGAFGGLSEAHHQILVMRELEGLSYREIGERLGMSRPSVESTLFRARRRLTEEYGELVSGERCLRIQQIIAACAGRGALGTRDQRRVGTHISYCQPCRKHARLAGLDAAAIARRPVRAKIAGLLPLPAFLRRRWLPEAHDDGGASAAAAQHAPSLAQLSMTAAQYSEPTMGGWIKAAALAGAVAVTGVGAGTAVHHARATEQHDAPVVQRSPGSGSGSSSAGGSSASGGSSGASATRARSVAASTGSSSSRASAPGRSSSSSAADRAAAGGAGGAGGATGGGTDRTVSTPNAGLPATPGGGAVDKAADQAPAPAKDPLNKVTDVLTGGGSGSSGGSTSAGSGGSSPPIVAPDTTQVLQPPAANAGQPPDTAGSAVKDVTNTAGATVGGAAGGAVQDAGQTAGSAVDQAAGTVGGTAGGILGGK
jgi:RNA polymerase sigma factor (sigma-70 family)